MRGLAGSLFRLDEALSSFDGDGPAFVRISGDDAEVGCQTSLLEMVFFATYVRSTSKQVLIRDTLLDGLFREDEYVSVVHFVQWSLASFYIANCAEYRDIFVISSDPANHNNHSDW
jgi:hypothetical protein